MQQPKKIKVIIQPNNSKTYLYTDVQDLPNKLNLAFQGLNK